MGQPGGAKPTSDTRLDTRGISNHERIDKTAIARGDDYVGKPPPDTQSLRDFGDSGDRDRVGYERLPGELADHRQAANCPPRSPPSNSFVSPCSDPSPQTSGRLDRAIPVRSPKMNQKPCQRLRSIKRPEPGSPLIAPSSYTISPRRTVTTGHPVTSQPSKVE